jgi:hypothetical protein
MAGVGLAQLGPAAQTAPDISALMGDEDRFGLARSTNQRQGFDLAVKARRVGHRVLLIEEEVRRKAAPGAG